MFKAELTLQEVKRILVMHFVHSAVDGDADNYDIDITWPEDSEGLMVTFWERDKTNAG